MAVDHPNEQKVTLSCDVAGSNISGTQDNKGDICDGLSVNNNVKGCVHESIVPVMKTDGGYNSPSYGSGID